MLPVKEKKISKIGKTVKNKPKKIASKT